MRTIADVRLWALLLGLVLAGCGRKGALAPPTIHYGQDICAECGMILSDERFAAAAVSADDTGEPKLFDDLGCWLAYRAKHPDTAGKAVFVHDMTTRQWLLADKAAYVRSEALQTPMGSGLAAVAPAGAPALRQQYNGTFLDFPQLLQQAPTMTRPH